MGVGVMVKRHARTLSAPGLELNVPVGALLISAAPEPVAAGQFAQNASITATPAGRRAETIYRRLAAADGAAPARAAQPLAAYERIVRDVGSRLSCPACDRPNLISQLATAIAGRTILLPDVRAGGSHYAGLPTWTLRVPLSSDPVANAWFTLYPQGRDAALGLLGKALGLVAVESQVLSHGPSVERLDPHRMSGFRPAPIEPRFRDRDVWRGEIARVTSAIAAIAVDRDRDFDRWSDHVSTGWALGSD
ncbi:MAG TPA: hypothetical protein VFI22_10915 [Thermomicrobiales bacterium]|nr:hypothetical protein [Thermomicrobiales bacterium]